MATRASAVRAAPYAPLPSRRRPVGQRVPAQAHGRVDRHIRRPTSSLQAPLPALCRRGGGGRSPPRRQHRNEATAGLLRGYYESYYEATTRLLRGYYEATTRPLPGHYQATTRLPRGYYQEPHARHSASSTAAAAPLVCRRRSRQQHVTSPRAAGCSWCAAQLALRPRRRRRARRASRPGPSGP